MNSEYINPGPNQRLCERCSASVLVRRVVTEATMASELDGTNTHAICLACWREKHGQPE